MKFIIPEKKKKPEKYLSVSKIKSSSSMIEEEKQVFLN
jgi:hypothetical protein